MSTPHDLEPTITTELGFHRVNTIFADAPPWDTAAVFIRLGVRVAPAADGRCVTAPAVSDSARRRPGGGGPPVSPRACSFREPYREPGGREIPLCLLEGNFCPFQRTCRQSGGRAAVVCAEPCGAPTDSRGVEGEYAPGPGDATTAEASGVAPDVPAADLARLILNRGVRWLLALDPAGDPGGVLSVADLIGAPAHPEPTAPGGPC